MGKVLSIKDVETRIKEIERDISNGLIACVRIIKELIIHMNQ